MSAPKVTTVSDLVNMYSSGKNVPLEALDSLQFQDALTVKADIQNYKKRTS